MRWLYLHGLALFLLGLGVPVSASATPTLLGSRILGSYNFPCISCDPNLEPPDLTGGSNYSYSTNPFVVNGTVETVLNLNPGHGDVTTNVMFTGDSLLLTLTAQVSYTSDPFNGPVFTVLSGHSFGSVTGIDTSLHCSPCSPVTAFVSGDSLFINWQGAGGDVGDTVAVDFTVGRPVGRAVPEPVALPLFATGLGLMALFAWRRKSALV
jgi:hypothetical protein